MVQLFLRIPAGWAFWTEEGWLVDFSDSDLCFGEVTSAVGLFGEVFDL